MSPSRRSQMSTSIQKISHSRWYLQQLEPAPLGCYHDPGTTEISALVHEDKDSENSGITHLLMQWGQFLDHDITSSSQSRGFNGSVPRCCKDGGRDFIPQEFMHPECLPIPVPPSDPFYGPRGVRCLDFVRSSPAPREDCALGWREQFNHVSSYIDGSPLYASSARQSDRLRLFRNGMLQYGRVQQRRPLLPAERDELCRGGALSTDCFKSGDARVNEHPGLVAKHIVWLRQHNRMAQELAHLNPHWSDEKIYQETRKIVGAMIQHITYREFLPIVLGPEVMRLFELELLPKGYFKGYSAKTNPNPASSFGTAAFRFGHSLVQSSMMRFDKFHRPINNNVSLHAELTNPSNIWSVGAVDRLLLGMLNQHIQKRDEFITEELTNHLFQTNHFNFGMDLAAINIQRGRDHGVPPYTAWREPCGLTPITDFDDLVRVMPARVVRKLKVLYRHVDDLDLFTGGVSERPVAGALVGPVFACIIAQQFSNLRKGDRFWYENGGFDSSFTPAQLQQIRRISLSQVLCSTLDSIDNIQPFAFLSHENPKNDRISCRNGLLNNFDLSAWIELHSDSNNIKKSDETQQSSKTKLKRTTVKPTTTTKHSQKTTQTLTQQKSEKFRLNNMTETENTDKDKDTNVDSKEPIGIKPNATVVIDDKLDFRNKSRRFTDFDDERNPPTRQYNDYYDDVQNVQSVVINNIPNNRPNRRPYISVTENIADKYTYLINYVPRPTHSWRQTTRRTHDRDVVKVTYQTYEDTYGRPNRPYFNRDELDNDFESRQQKPVTESFQSSARSIDNEAPSPQLKLSTESSVQTEKNRPIETQTDKTDATTENLYKLLTFGYVGTYKRDKIVNDDNKDLKDNKNKHDSDHNISLDFSTVANTETDVDDKQNVKLSTFIIYDTATKPYLTSSQRPTRRNDDETTEKKDKYYFIQNVLHKYSETKGDDPKKTSSVKDKTNTDEYIGIEQRLGNDSLDDDEKPVNVRAKIKSRKPSSSAKTPSVAFQIIPSENNPSQWAVYEEKEDLSGQIPQMPSIKVDPHALREVPRPMNFGFRKRHG
ncbi:unnamed protein product [Danaus chrysippus]|uniref:(African queen) hypothetical protein n=1 Tax=Danaus chrysippus TaxID=151541 RepID=A0A8J2WBN1_9NEOP|nr:unnamed protein product [Danaus chrysippus]